MSEENKIIGEQPSQVDTCAVATGIEKEVNQPDGSPLGKFQNPEKLLDAYNELQSEFTRKCQKLSEVEKQLQCVAKDEESGTLSNVETQEFAWNKNLKEFLQTHKFANTFAEEITKELIDDENLKNAEDGLERAYYKVLDKNYVGGPQQNFA